MTPFKHLFTPLTIRRTEIRNRILSTGHQTYLAAADCRATTSSPITRRGRRAAPA